MTRAQIDRLRAAGRFDEALELAVPLAEQARRGGDVEEACRLTLTEARLLDRVGRPAAAQQRLAWILERVEHGPERSVFRERRLAWVVSGAFTEWTSAALQGQGASLAEVHAVLDRYRVYLDEIGWGDRTVGLLTQRARAFGAAGETDRAVELMLEALQQRERVQDSPGMALISLRREVAWWLSTAGRHQEAIALLEAAYRTPDLKHLDRLGIAVYLGHACLKVGDGVAAAEWAVEAITHAAPMTAKQQAAAWGLAVEAWLAADRVEDAARAAEHMCLLAEEIGSDGYRFSAQQDSFDVHLHRGELAAAGERLAEMARLLARIERSRPDLELRAELATRQERMARARAGGRGGEG